MAQLELINYLTAQLLLQIRNPTKYDFIPNGERRMQQQLALTAKAIVLHDRALNGLK